MTSNSLICYKYAVCIFHLAIILYCYTAVLSFYFVIIFRSTIDVKGPPVSSRSKSNAIIVNPRQVINYLK